MLVRYESGFEERKLTEADKPSKYFYIASLIICVILIMISCLAPFSAGWFLSLKPSGDSGAQWFERTGAVTTIFSLLALNLLDDTMNRLVDPRKLTSKANVDLYMLLEKPVAFLKAIAFLLGLFGTAVWGYGSVIVRFFPSLAP
jgi:hypothetical protein